MIFRAALFVDCVIFETAQLQDLGGKIQIGSHILRFVGIGSYGDDLTAQLMIAAQNIGTGMRLSETVAEASGVQFQTFSLLHGFTGTDRRFEYKGTIGGVTIVDDYAHHPTEIAATLHAAANYPHKTLWCVFQPHTYTRTKAFMKDFAKALSLADKVVLADIYAARETDTLGISSETLQTEIRALGHECYYFPSFDEIENFLLENCINGDLLITMGAGDVVKIGENLLGK